MAIQFLDPEPVIDAILARVQSRQADVIPFLLLDENQTWTRPNGPDGNPEPALTELPPIASFEGMADSNQLAVPPVLTCHPLGSVEAPTKINEPHVRAWEHYFGLQVFTAGAITRQVQQQLFAYTRLLYYIIVVQGAEGGYGWLGNGLAGLGKFQVEIDRVGYGEPLPMEEEPNGFGQVLQMRLRIRLIRK